MCKIPHRAIGEGFLFKIYIFTAQPKNQTIKYMKNALLFVKWLFLNLFLLSLNAKAQYCPALHGACGALEIKSVSLNTLSTANVCGGANGYNYYPSSQTPATTLIPGQTYSLNISVNGTSNASAWFDFNANQTFETFEWVQLGTSISNDAKAIIYVPAYASTGKTRMRIRVTQTGNTHTASSACTAFTNGETEEYDIVIGQELPQVNVGPLPTITTISPLSGLVGSLDTITGTNFSTTSTSNVVMYGLAKANVVSATTTQLIVQVPNSLTNDPIQVTVNGLTASSKRAFHPKQSTSKTLTNFSFETIELNHQTTNEYDQVSAIDLNNDGLIELLTSKDGTLYILTRSNNSNRISSESFKTALIIKESDIGAKFRFADMDNDGRLDIVCINTLRNNITIYKNNIPSGAVVLTKEMFKYSYKIPTYTPSNIITPDLDNDGKRDIVVTNNSYNTVSIFRNIGNSNTMSFTNEYTYTTNSYPFALTAIDIDNDDKLDIAISTSSSTISLFKNTSTVGNISLNTPINLNILAAASELQSADMDNDGKNDLIVSCNGSAISVFRNSGSTNPLSASSFAARVDFTTSAYGYGSMSIGEFNGDGKLDISFLGLNGYYIWQNNSNQGSFSSGSLSLAYSNNSLINQTIRNTFVCDINNDRQNDIIYLTNNNLSVLKNIVGSFSINIPQSTVPKISGDSLVVNIVAENPFSIGNNFTIQLSDVLGTFNTPLNLKSIASVTSSSQTFLLPKTLSSGEKYTLRLLSSNPNLVSDTSSEITIISPPSITSFSPISAQPGSLLTITGLNFENSVENNTVSIAGEIAQVIYASPTMLKVIVPNCVSPSFISVSNRFDKTGVSSLIFTPSYTGESLLSSNSFGTPVRIPTNANPTAISFGNMTPAKLADLVVSLSYAGNGGGLGVLRNTHISDTANISSTSFSNIYSNTLSGSSISSEAVNLSKTKSSFIVSISYNIPSLTIIENSPSFSGVNFMNYIGLTLPGNPEAFSYGDLDNDGKTDLITLQPSSANVSVFKNIYEQGTNFTSFSFAPRKDILVPSNSVDLRVIDLDADNRPELVVINFTNVLIYKNISSSGIIAFNNPILLPLSSIPKKIIVGDLNLDSKPELLISNGTRVSIFENLCTSSAIAFGTRFDLISGSGAWGISIGDIDGNGKPDIAVANSLVDSIAIFANNYTSGSLSLSNFANVVRLKMPPNSQPRSIAIGDISGDLRPEILVSLYNDSSIFIIPNNTDISRLISTRKKLNINTPYSLYFTTTRTFNSGNIFSVQLSDSNGSFTAPITLGTASSVQSCAISITIPSSLPESSGYFLRVVSSNPISISNQTIEPISIIHLPTITSISSNNIQIDSLITITGSNFSNVATNNIVYFGPVQAKITSASNNTLIVKNPLGNIYKPLSITTTENKRTSISSLQVNTKYPGNSGILNTYNFNGYGALILGGSYYNPTFTCNGDFDGDGLTDILSVSNSNLSFCVFKNNYSGLSDFNSNVFVPVATTITEGNFFKSACVASDIDGDGKSDLITKAGSNSKLNIYKNTSTLGYISFDDAYTVGTIPSYSKLVVADLDNDGKPELIYSKDQSSSGPSILVYKNNINGPLNSSSFASKYLDLNFYSFNDIKAVDLNNDGLMDLLANDYSGNVYLLVNKTGEISNEMFDIVNIANYVGTSKIIVSDLNRDSKPDFIVASGTNLNIFNNQYNSGTISSSSFVKTTVSLNTSLENLVQFDVDGDGVIDLVSNTNANGVYIFKGLNNQVGGNPSFSSGTWIAQSYDDIDIGDFNNDGKIDLSSVNANAAQINLILNTTPLFSLQNTYPLSICKGENMVIAYNAPSLFQSTNSFIAQLSDVNGSFSNPTIIGSNQSLVSGNIIINIPTTIANGSKYKIRLISTDPVIVSTNTISAKLLTCPTITNISTQSAQPGQNITLNGTNFSTSPSDNNIHIGGVKALVNAATSSQLQFTLPKSSTPKTVNLTLNGYIVSSSQILYPTFSGNNILNASSFSAKTEPITGLTGAQDFCITDFDNDGKQDLAVTISNEFSINIYRNLTPASSTMIFKNGNQIGVNTISNSSFDNAIVLNSGYKPTSIITTDINNDSKQDIVCLNSGSNSISIYLNTSTVGNITFANKKELLLDIIGLPYAIASGDLDSDGIADLVIAYRNNNSCYIYKNYTINDSIILKYARSLSTQNSPSSIAIIELSGDNKPDIVVANSGNGTFSVFKNNTSFGIIDYFQLSNFTIGGNPRSVTTADINQDGKTDLLIANATGNHLYVCRNTTVSGTISFTNTSYTTSGATGGNFIATGDTDGDGKQDIIVSNATSNNITVYKNNSTTSTISLAAGFNLATQNNPSAISVCDFDADYRPDIFVLNTSSNSLSVFGNITSAPEPTSNASAFTVSNPTNTTLTLNWTNGNGSRRIILAKALTAVNSTPTDENIYNANSAFGLGTQIGIENYVVYDGTGTTVTVTGLNLLTQYHFRIFEYNGTGGAINYLTTGTTISNGTTLPVTLVSFNAKEQNGKALLTWVTSSEINNSHFDVERSTDGKTFTKVGEVAGSGNSNTVKTYRFVDELTNAKVTYYRLKQVDFNGDFTYSNIINLNSKGLNATSTISIYPNPANSSISIDGLTEQAFIYDAVGRVVATITENGLVDVNHLTPGVYFVKTNTETVKFIKQ